MSDPIQQLPDIQRRLDVALKEQLIAVGARFLYTINGSGKCYEGTLHEISALGHVRLNDRGTWDWPPEVTVEELLPPAPKPAPEVRLEAAQNPPEAGATLGASADPESLAKNPSTPLQPDPARSGSLFSRSKRSR